MRAWGVEELDVSRETVDNLKGFGDLLLKWNKSINLISPKTSNELWERHILDSAQLALHIPPSNQLAVDLGTGGGFPGVVLSMIYKEKLPSLRYIFIESDKRKSAFLQNAIGQFRLNAEVCPERIESAPVQNAGIVTARALAPLSKLVSYAYRHLDSSGTALFLKGRSVELEIEEALASWSMRITRYPSKITSDGTILKISDIRPA